VSATDVITIAGNLAYNCGYSVFPCRHDKRPACPHGFKDATADPVEVRPLWRRYPGPLIGVATGVVSGVDILDIDTKHDTALAWYHDHRPRLPVTRTFRTRSGGLHFYLLHADGLGCSAGKLAPGVDIRGDGGYAIHWFAAGFPCLDHEPPAPWPAWLLADLLKRKPASHPPRSIRPDHSDRAIDGALRLVTTAANGERNAILHWSACRLGEHVRAGQLGAGEAEALLVAAGTAAGLAEQEARATARSGLRRAAA
jgi:hypothetical protein